MKKGPEDSRGKVFFEFVEFLGFIGLITISCNQ